MNEDRNRLVNEAWKELINNCEHHIRFDPNSHLSLCNHIENSGTVPQHKGTKRCNILCCPRAGQVHAYVKKVMEAKTKDLERVYKANPPVMQLSSNVIRLA
jgi:hypothetical protein